LKLITVNCDAFVSDSANQFITEFDLDDGSQLMNDIFKKGIA
jgi:hypothetical protein